MISNVSRINLEINNNETECEMKNRKDKVKGQMGDLQVAYSLGIEEPLSAKA
jgi:hypothetical protein